MSSGQQFTLRTIIMAHPDRAAQAAALARHVPGAEVVFDPEPDGRRDSMRATYAAWSAGVADATHVLVIQDDVILSDTFLPTVLAGIELLPDAALAFYAHNDSPNGALIRLSAAAGADWVEAITEADYLPCQAVLMPVPLVRRLTEFMRPLVGLRFDDDDVLAQFLTTAGVPTYLSVPSVVNHGQFVSLIGNDERSAALYSHFHPASAGSGQRLAHSVTACPYFSKGVAYCMLRVDDGTHDAWRQAHWLDAVRWLGLDRAVIEEGFEQHRAADDQVPALVDHIGLAYVHGIWVTAYLTGHVLRTGAVPVRRLTDGATTPVSSDLLIDGWAAMGEGGLFGTLLHPRSLDGWGKAVSAVAQAAYEAAGGPTP
ncbi:hypothetical protein [Catellatospora sp. NPDC049609]|uniref:hypothetical protein n=1 Tax=Catellatospora sp. NPDC049609 TaxID=3155505 RepID=UPI0034245247